jgi:hypothetical protein
MPRNGSGTYSLPAGQPVVTNTTISSTTFNTLTSDLSTAITQSVCSDGQTPMTGNLNMGSKKIVSMADGVNPTDAASYSQLTTNVSTLNTSISNVYQYIPYKNPVINSQFSVAQRATTYALTTTAAYGSMDGWVALQATTASGIFNQVSDTAGNGATYNAKLGRNNAATTTGAITMAQAFESINSKPFAGKTVILSFYAKAGANLSSTSNNITYKLAYGTGTDQSSSSLVSGTWTGYTNAISTTTAITTSWVKYQTSVALSSSATQLGIIITYTPTGTAGADDNIYISDVKLEVAQNANTTPTVLQRNSYTQDLLECQRYLHIGLAAIIMYGAGAGSFIDATTYFPVTMRANPSVTQLSNNAIFTQANVTTTTSNQTLLTTCAFIWRLATAAGVAQFSESNLFSAEL